MNQPLATRIAVALGAFGAHGLKDLLAQNGARAAPGQSLNPLNKAQTGIVKYYSSSQLGLSIKVRRMATFEFPAGRPVIDCAAIFEP